MKGLSDFITLAQSLDRSFQVVLVGLTKEQIKEMPDTIIGIERTANIKELVRIYAIADVFVNLTYCDSYGLVNVESFLCGTPVISYDTGGCSESVKGHGVTVKKGDLKAVIKEISLLKNNSYTTHIDRYKYDMERYLMEFNALYEEVLIENTNVEMD